MTRTVVNASTFAATAKPEVKTFGSFTRGTVEVTLAGETKRVPATLWDTKHRGKEIFVYGMVGRYRTGTKAWPAHVIHTVETGAEHINFGRDDRASHFKKLNALFFAD